MCSWCSMDCTVTATAFGVVHACHNKLAAQQLLCLLLDIHLIHKLGCCCAAERDLYLAWSLKRSKAVNGACAVVGVVGKGHLRGIVYVLKHDHGNLRFADLVGGKNRKTSKAEAAATFVKWLLVELLIGAAVYGIWVAVSSALMH